MVTTFLKDICEGFYSILVSQKEVVKALSRKHTDFFKARFVSIDDFHLVMLYGKLSTHIYSRINRCIHKEMTYYVRNIRL